MPGMSHGLAETDVRDLASARPQKQVIVVVALHTGSVPRVTPLPPVHYQANPLTLPFTTAA